MKSLIRVFVFLLVAVSCVVSSSAVHAVEETVLQFRSFDDPEITPNPDVCLNAPFYDENFPPNVLLGASLWTLQTNAATGEVVNDKIRQVGITEACVLITGLSPRDTAPFYMEFNVEDLVMQANGECTVTSNTVPVDGLVLTGCTLEVYSDPAENILGGIATSNSVFNPFSIPGFQTGSFWTVHLYTE